MTRLFIFGTSGLLGSNLANLSVCEFTSGSYNLREGLGFKLDVNDFNAVDKLLAKIKPDVIINATALNNVDYCETHQEEAKKVNIDFVNHLAKRKEKIVHISSDLVFDGTSKRSYNEEDELRAVNYYGYTKIVGEELIMSNKNNLVVRASVVYGTVYDKNESSGRKPNNFGMWLLDELNNENEVNIVTDEYSTPILVNDLARSILHLIKGNYSGIYHAAMDEPLTRYDFACKLGKYFGFDTDRLIKPIKTIELGRKVYLSLNKCLNTVKLQSTGYKFMTLEETFKLMKQEDESKW